MYTWERTEYNRDNDSYTPTVSSLTRSEEGVGHKVYMDNFFSSPDIYEDLYTRHINCCGTIRQRTLAR
jgi:hypothetical protein